MKHKIRLLVLVSALAFTASADKIVLKNGDQVTGKIMNSDDKTIWVKSALMGEVKIDRTGISSITTDAPVYVTLKSGEKVNTNIVTEGETFQLKKLDNTVATAAPAEVVAIRDDTAQAAWEREQQRLLNPPLNDFWVGNANFALANANGNSKTRSYATTAGLSRQAGKNKMTLYFNQLYAAQYTIPPFSQNANRISGGFRMDRDLTKKLFAFGTADFDYDKFLLLDLRNVLGGGLGYHIWKTEKGYWDANVGGVWNREKFATGLVRNSAEILLGEESGWKPYDKLRLFQRLSFFPNVSDTGNYRVTFDATAGVPVYKWLELTVGYQLRYLSNPIAGRKTTDTLLTTGVGISFDQVKR